MKRLMNPQSLAVLEMGAGQREAIEAVFQKAGFKILFISKDLAGIERTIGISV